MRPSYTDSVRILKDRVEIIGDALPVITRNPRHDDEVLGPSFFRMRLRDAALEELTLPALFVGRSELKRCSFRGCDLNLSTFNWTDLEQCAFVDADLSRADLRACRFVRCSFERAVLDAADLRGSSFDHCSFAEASLAGTLLVRRPLPMAILRIGGDQRWLPLSPEQRRMASWSSEAPAPGGR
jgi:uncharacterized protein YjbI with pentapeptide repeats